LRFRIANLNPKSAFRNPKYISLISSRLGRPTLFRPSPYALRSSPYASSSTLDFGHWTPDFPLPRRTSHFARLTLYALRPTSYCPLPDPGLYKLKSEISNPHLPSLTSTYARAVSEVSAFSTSKLTEESSEGRR